jgi:hypothetical protein
VEDYRLFISKQEVKFWELMLRHKFQKVLIITTWIYQVMGYKTIGIPGVVAGLVKAS